MTLYKIANWRENFDHRDSGRNDGPMKWVKIPTKTDGLGFRRIALQKDAPELLAAWYLMVGIAAKQERANRGDLSRDGIPLTAEDMGIITGFPVRIFERALPFFSNPSQGWIVAEPSEKTAAELRQTAAEVPQVAAEVRHVALNPRLDKSRLDESRVEEIRSDERPDAFASPQVAAELPQLAQTDDQWIASLKSSPAYAGIDVEREHAKMTTWCVTNRKQPSRRRFVNWLNRCDKPMRSAVGALEPRFDKF